MKKLLTPYIYIPFFIASLFSLNAQEKKVEFHLNNPFNRTDSNSKKELFGTATDKNDLNNQLQQLANSLVNRGYFLQKTDSIIETDDNYLVYYDPGIYYEEIRIKIPAKYNSLLKGTDLDPRQKNYLDIRSNELEWKMKSTAEQIETKGYTFVTLQLTSITFNNTTAMADLLIQINESRKIDKVVVKGYEGFPKNFIPHALGLKPGQTFSKSSLEKANQVVESLSFANLTKPAEALFTNDSTLIYLTIEKKKSNYFDGILGFASDPVTDELSFNGYLDLGLENIFNAGESIQLFWKSNGQQRQRFSLSVRTPYIFGTTMIPSLNFELYRQDSTFSNTSFKADLSYKLHINHTVGALIRLETSTDLDSGASNISSFSNRFFGLQYTGRLYQTHFVFPEKASLALEVSTGNRETDNFKDDQSRGELKTHYLYSFNQHHHLFLQNHSGILLSQNYLTNELFRIGGINNLRGVNEESIFASAYSIFNLEYRYATLQNSYLFSITDLGFTDNRVSDQTSTITSLGLGYSFMTKVGRFQLSYAVGKFDSNPFDWNNSKIHVKIISLF